MKIIEKLSEAECYLYVLLMDPSGIDQCEFTVKEPENEDNCFRCWPFQYSWWRDNEIYNIDMGSRCVQEDSLILTEDGWRKIQEVEVGTKVLTHKNRWREVTDVYDNGMIDAVELSGYGREQKLTVTPDHRIWGARSRRASMPKDGHKRFVLDEPSWIKAEDWEFSDKSQIGNTHWATPAEFESLDIPEQMKAIIHGTSNIVDNFLSVEFMWLYGLFLAEGSTYIDDQFACAKWSLHKQEISDVAPILDSIGLNYNVSYSKSDLSASINVNSRPLVKWINSNTPKYAHNKEVPKWVFGLSTELREAVLDGICYGDGHLRPSGRHEVVTTSMPLALDIKMLALSLGFVSSINLHKEAGTYLIERRTGPTRKSYVASVWKDNCLNSRVRFMDGKGWSGVSKIVPVGKRRMWDLEVKEDHSFVANGTVVHNSIGKSYSIEAKAYAFPFIHEGDEMVITAPEGVHLDAITDRIETMLTDNRLTAEYINRGRGGIKHRPFMVNFSNGSRIMGRIPRHDGSGIKGTHPIVLEMDEAQNYPESGWVELFETLKSSEPGAMFRAHGVTRGVRDSFFKFTQPNSGWKVHHYTSVHRPNWTKEERDKKIENYGSRDNPDFRRNVYGFHGDSSSPIFILSRLMKCVDTEDGKDGRGMSEFNEDYHNLKINAEALDDVNGNIEHFLDFTAPDGLYWIGADIGWTTDPTEVLVFKEEHHKTGNVFNLVCRVQMRRVDAPLQAALMMELARIYRPKRLALDRTGAGLPLLQVIQDLASKDQELRRMLDTMIGFNFSEKILFELDDSVEVDKYTGDLVKEAGIYRKVLECSTEVLRRLVDQKKLHMPYDKELIGEFSGQTIQNTKGSGMDSYGRKVQYSTGSFHTLDAARMAALAWHQYYFTQILEKKLSKPLPSTEVIFL